MASELLVKRLMMQASVSVLAGLLMSSAVLAEDTAGDAGDPPEVSVDDGAPDVSIDPVELDDGGMVGGEDGGEWTDEDLIATTGWVEDEVTVEDSTGAEGGEGEGGDGGAVDGDDPIDGCAECSGEPEVSIDPIEMDGTPIDNPEVVYMADGEGRGFEPNQRGLDQPNVLTREDRDTTRNAVRGDLRDAPWWKRLFKTE